MPICALIQEECEVNPPLIFHSAWAGILISLVSWPVASADSWGPPMKEHWSASKQWVLKVGWRDSKKLSLWEKTDDGLKEHWRRGYVDRVWPPHRAYVTDNGKYVVLRDVYHNLGYGKVIVILGEGGTILGSYELQDFLPQDEIRQSKHTVSSLWWNEHAWFSFIDDDKQFALVTQVGTVRSFDLSTGKLLDLTEDQRAKIVDLVRCEAKALVESEKAGDRIRGITLLGGIGVKESIPVAQKLFQDMTRTGSVGRSGRPGVETHGVQKAAALALTRLMGADAIPIIEKELSRANWYTKGELLEVLARFDTKGYEIVQTPDSAAVMEMWKRLASHDSDDIRYPALCHVLRRDDGTYLFDHPDLIESENDSVRGTAVGLLAKIDSPKALTLLRKAITDKQDSIRRSALRHLIDQEPPNIEDVLLPYLDDDSASIRVDVICELACRENPAATKKLGQTIATWPTVDLDGDDKWARRREIETLCKLIADLKLHEAKDSLVNIRSVTVPLTAISVAGALAALGDNEALGELHRLASEGDVRDRALAIEMCRYVSDEKSTALVRQAAESNERQLQYAATKELMRFKYSPN